jgi:Abortive infection alpha
MSDSSLIPFGDEQAKAAQEIAKAAQEALKALQGLGGFFRSVLGTVPEDLVGYLLGADSLRVRRMENLAQILRKSQERLQARKVEPDEPASLSLTLPIIAAAAEESRDELQDLWARLLAAAADPARAKFFRNAFIDAAKKMDPGDATVLGRVGNGLIDNNAKGELARALNLSRDIVEVSLSNLAKLDLLAIVHAPEMTITPFGRVFLRAVSD